ncbi:LysR family transcriptional regulator [Dyella kyungheensis]|jgi:DNA-binding transcriptional LysR family regulator|uniref:LysR family transcriptional regulator n=1 Tax=Dyella kyungheensis TaxID=1242174 RepID=A0ABS2JUT4_9GAMM|nr:LysR family transcriptional regulator [Dyella kyungheensis]MBM7122766.1 LysR family transcriptional regulator [Dyella kyungheensis]
MLTSVDIEFFAVIAESSSLAAAARRLDVTPPAVSQRLRQLESRMGVRLVDRSSKQLNLTPEGELLAARGAGVLSDIEVISAALSKSRNSVSGPLRVAAPFGFGRAHVAPAMAAMKQRFPDVELVLNLFDNPLGSVRSDSWDVLVHLGAPPDSTFRLRRLAPNRRVLCAAPDYLERHGEPLHPDDLRRHVCGVIREDEKDVSLWRFTLAQSESPTVRIRPAFASNDGDVVTAWVLAGLGIVERSEWAVADDLRAGRLIEVLPDWRLADADVVALLGPREGRAVRVDHFVDTLREALTPTPWRS